MRVLLASSASYDPPRGGSTRSNLAWLKHLAASGHTCRVVGGVPVAESRMEGESSLAPGLSVLSVSDAKRRDALSCEIEGFRPDWVLVSSEDLSHTLLGEAHRCAEDRVVYLAHTPQFYPFGPAAWNPDAEASRLVTRSAGIVAIAHFTAAYIREHAGCEVEVIHPPIYGRPPFARLDVPESAAVAMINPCAMKGISIFLALARRFSDVAFAALPGWGTTELDRRALNELTNFRWLKPCRDIEHMLAETRILLVPSLWLEGFGLIVVEAMLRGIPVLAADEGGLKEAKLGTRFSLPVNGIREFASLYDDRRLPLPVVPIQNAEPWVNAVSTLLSDRALYDVESEASQQAAQHFVSQLQPERFEHFLQNLSTHRAPHQQATTRPADLSRDKRELLLRRLREVTRK